MTKRIYLLIALFLLVLVAVLLVVRNDKSTISSKHSRFSFEVPSDIDSFVIQSGKGKVSLVQTSSGWKTNDQQADENKIKLLVETLRNLHTLTPVVGDQQRKYKNKLDSNVCSIIVWQSKKRAYQMHFISEEGRNISYIRKPEKLYFIAIRGFEKTPLKDIISCEQEYWRKNVILYAHAKNIIKIKINYPLLPDQNFELHQTDNNLFELSSDSEIYKKEELDESKIWDYLHFYNGISFTLPDTLLYKPIIREKNKIFDLWLETNNSGVTTIQGYPLLNIENKKADLYKLCAITNEDRLVYLNYEDIDPLLANPDYFLKK